MDSKLERFTKEDWNTYAGALCFSDNSKPFIGSNVMLEVVADINGLCIMPVYDEKVCMQGGWCLVIDPDLCTADMVKMLAERVLEDTKNMFPAEIKRYISEKGLCSDLRFIERS